MEKSRINKLRISPKGVEFWLTLFSWKDEDHYLIYIPALEMSGYGDTMEEAEELLKVSVLEYGKTLLSLSKSEQLQELYKYNFKRNKLRHKEFKAPYVNREGVLKNLRKEDDSIEHIEEKQLAIAV